AGDGGEEAESRREEERAERQQLHRWCEGPHSVAPASGRVKTRRTPSRGGVGGLGKTTSTLCRPQRPQHRTPLLEARRTLSHGALFPSSRRSAPFSTGWGRLRLARTVANAVCRVTQLFGSRSDPPRIASPARPRDGSSAVAEEEPRGAQARHVAEPAE